MKNVLKKTLLPAIAATTLLAGTAMAQDNERGFYAGGGFGRFNIELDTLDGVGDTIESFDNDDTAWKIFGGWRFNRYFALEAAYIDFGAPSDRFTADGSSGDYTVGLSGFAPSLVATYPLGKVELFGKLGYYFYDVDVSADFDDVGDNPFAASASDENLIWGGGLGMNFLDNRLNTRLEYEVVDLENVDNSNALWISASWRF